MTTQETQVPNVTPQMVEAAARVVYEARGKHWGNDTGSHVQEWYRDLATRALSAALAVSGVGEGREALQQMQRDLGAIATLTGGDVHVVVQRGGTPRVRVYVDRNDMGYRDSQWADQPTLAGAVEHALGAAIRSARGGPK